MSAIVPAASRLNAGFSYNDAEIRRDFCRIANRDLRLAVA